MSKTTRIIDIKEFNDEEMINRIKKTICDLIDNKSGNMFVGEFSITTDGSIPLISNEPPKIHKTIYKLEITTGIIL